MIGTSVMKELILGITWTKKYHGDSKYTAQKMKFSINHFFHFFSKRFSQAVTKHMQLYSLFIHGVIILSYNTNIISPWFIIVKSRRSIKTWFTLLSPFKLGFYSYSRVSLITPFRASFVWNNSFNENFNSNVFGTVIPAGS